MIDITVDGMVHSIPFTIGDERSEELTCAVYSVEDMVVPPNSVYTVKGMPKQSQKDLRLKAHSTWLVEPDDEEHAHSVHELEAVANDMQQRAEGHTSRHTKRREIGR